jgi:hypothetical protein
MKRTPKKLSLNRETVRALNPSELSRVAGASCAGSGCATCVSCAATCGGASCDYCRSDACGTLRTCPV